MKRTPRPPISPFWQRLLPILESLPGYSRPQWKSDLFAGLTVALVLIPQSMAYAQLAGLPAYYGLYAAFLPPTIAALFGSSRQLATGPVAVVSLMTAVALQPLAASGSPAFIGYAALLSLMVGLLQFCLGILRLGLVVNFLSHPVINGFTNAAAIIIATGQLSKLFGVAVDQGGNHLQTVAQVVRAGMNYTHWPTLMMALFAFAVMAGLKRISVRIPGVLVAVAATTLISWATGFEQRHTQPLMHPRRKQNTGKALEGVIGRIAFGIDCPGLRYLLTLLLGQQQLAARYRAH